MGAIRLENLRAFLSDEEIELMRKIKKIFDPNNILNPGRVIL
ncbi:MAG: FAD-linked oxidase C-terminal domain-containing protein [Candidatus Njordarchaeum guaymaensis]